MYQVRVWTEEDILATIDTAAPEPESGTLDYKNAMFLHHPDKSAYKKHKAEFVRHVSAFANGQGGVILIGIEDKTYQLQGIKADECKPYETLHQIINAHISPPIQGVDIRPVSLDTAKPGHVVLVVQIPMSYDGPHMNQYGSRDGGTEQEYRYYRRIGSQSLVMDHQMVLEVWNRARSPELDIEIFLQPSPNELLIQPKILNVSRVLAEQVFCVVKSFGLYSISHLSVWGPTNRGIGYGSGRQSNLIVYPELAESTGTIEFKPISHEGIRAPLYLKFDIFAKDMSRKSCFFAVQDFSFTRIDEIPADVTPSH